MKGPRKLFAALVFIVTVVALGSASDIYIAQNAAGANTGADCTDAHSASWFNTSSNWGSGSGQIGPGTTVHLCGVFTAPAGSNGYLVFQSDGSSGQNITLFFESGAVLQSPYFGSASGAISTAGHNFILIDGNNKAGVIENTMNGTPGASCLGGSCSYQQSSSAIVIGGSHDVEIRGLKFVDLYIHTSISDNIVSNSGVSCVYSSPVQSNISIHDNLAHDASWCYQLQFGSNTASNIQIYNNEIYNMDHGIALAMNSASGNFSNVGVYSNYIHDAANWDTTTDSYHHDGIHSWNYAGSTFSGLSIYNNLFSGNWGTNNTAHIYLETNSFSNLSIFNNVFIENTGNLLNNGMIAAGATGGIVYNNTFICDPSVNGMLGMYLSGSALSIKNNAFSGCQTYLTVPSGGSFDYNVYAGSNGGGTAPWIWKGTYEHNFSNWQSASGGDVNGQNPSNLDLSSSGAPNSNSPLISAGVNLTSVGVVALNSATSNGNQLPPIPRPASGSWDVGAFAVGAALAPPTQLSATVN